MTARKSTEILRADILRLYGYGSRETKFDRPEALLASENYGIFHSLGYKVLPCILYLRKILQVLLFGHRVKTKDNSET